MYRFITSLTTAKMYPTPPSIDKLTDLFQEFYVQAENHISVHIQALSSKKSREASPAPSIALRLSNSSKALSVLSASPSREKLRAEKSGSAQQMLTPIEISERRKARRMLEYKRILLEEAVERRVCEGIYPRIFKHNSSLDEIRDEKLRSKTAALSLVGITLKDLGVTFDSLWSQDGSNREAEIEEWITKARAGLLDMNEKHYPFGKLQGLAAAHQHIVEMLTILHKSSSSADEILPTLIYTLITCPPEGISLISNLCFMQRFRSSSKINGEAAYCLTNLEAAITFLENVDLATLRSEEAIDSNSKQDMPLANQTQDTEFPFNRGTAKAIIPTVTPSTAISSRPNSSAGSTTALASPTHTKRLSTLFQPSANAFGVASDAVRNSADAGLKNISQAMDNSFKLLFGRLKEQHIQGPGSASDGTVIVPKTLDEARKLVSPRPVLDEDGNISEQSSFTEQEHSSREDKRRDILNELTRDRSADSASSSGRRLNLRPLSSDGPSDPPPTSVPTSALDSMRSLGNSLNPLNRFTSVNVMRGFGRSSSSLPSITSSPLASNDQSKDLKYGITLDSAGEMHPPPTARIDPPIQRFMDMTDAGELKLAEVQGLLKDYQRLAKVVRDLRLC